MSAKFSIQNVPGRSETCRRRATAPRLSRHWHWFLPVLLAVLTLAAHAQVPPGGLTQLMMSQPPVDISTPVTATASFDPPLVRPGEKSVYRVSFNATEVSIRWPEEIPAPPSLKLRRTASGQIMQPVGGGMLRPLTIFNYEAHASAAGRFTVPELVVDVYGQPIVVPAAQLEVQTAPASPHEPARELLLETSATNVYVGEAFTVRVLLLATSVNSVEGVSQVQLNGDGFVVDKNIVRQSIQTLKRNGRQLGAYTYETSVTPIAAGALKLSAQGFTAGMQFGGPVVISGQVTLPGGLPKYVLLDSEAADIQVRPLPVEGELPGFAGAVGSYTCDRPLLATNVVSVGEPVQIKVTIHGRQNPGRIAPPRPPLVKGWQIFPAVHAGLTPESETTLPGAIFSYTLIPTTDEVRATPAIPFSCFDPRRGAYVDITIQPVPVTVRTPAGFTNEAAAVLPAESTFEPETKLALSKFAPTPGKTADSLVPLQLRGRFWLVQLVVAPGFFGLWWWARRRRYLEMHPEVVRRRRARRELRRVKRSLQAAARAGTAADFIRCAVRALQIVCAPHYPAEPRALVGGDVLEILSATERQGRAGEVVRRFFAAGDATAFATSAPGHDELLGLQTELADVLEKLEARL